VAALLLEPLGQPVLLVHRHVPPSQGVNALTDGRRPM
jgi:hypothetical protein